MAITSVLGGQGRISDATLTAMLNSGDRDLINRANEYIEGAKKEAEERGTDKGILGIISDLFGFSKLAAAEPDMFNNQSNNQFSVTQPSQFDFKRAQLLDPTNIMRGSVVENVVDTPIREFGNIRGIPTKEEAETYFDSMPKEFELEKWCLAIQLCYGLRNHELFHIEKIIRQKDRGLWENVINKLNSEIKQMIN